MISSSSSSTFSASSSSASSSSASSSSPSSTSASASSTSASASSTSTSSASSASTSSSSSSTSLLAGVAFAGAFGGGPLGGGFLAGAFFSSSSSSSSASSSSTISFSSSSSSSSSASSSIISAAASAHSHTLSSSCPSPPKCRSISSGLTVRPLWDVLALADPTGEGTKILFNHPIALTLPKLFLQEHRHPVTPETAANQQAAILMIQPADHMCIHHPAGCSYRHNQWEPLELRQALHPTHKPRQNPNRCLLSEKPSKPPAAGLGTDSRGCRWG